MITLHKAVLAGGMAVLLGAGLAGTALAAGQPPSTDATTAPSASATSGTSRTADLAFSREEERMARDLYTLFGHTYDAAVFDRIATSEQHHFDAVGALLTTYAIADPAAGQQAGTYADPELQKMYDQWKVQGLTSVQDAYAVGVALEQTDIADLEGILATNPEADVQRVFTHMLTASRHHLEAFTTALNGGDASSCDGTGAGAGPGADKGPGMGTGLGMGMGDGHGTEDGAVMQSRHGMDDSGS